MKMTLNKWILGLIFLCPALAMAATVPPYKATYSFQSNKANGTITKTLTYPSEGQYKIQSVIKAKKLFFSDTIKRTSMGTINDNYVKAESIQVSDLKEKKNVTRSLINNEQDNLSSVLQARLNLMENKTHFSIDVYNDGKTQTLQFTVSNPSVVVATPMGNLEALQVTATGDKGHTITYWFSKEKDYALLKAQVMVNGSVNMTTIIQSYQQMN